MDRDWAGILGLGLVVLLIGGAIGFAAGVWQSPNVLPELSAPAVDPRIEYYRGAYDVCVNFTVEVFAAPIEDAKIFCNQTVVAGTAREGWYESNSEDYAPPGEYVPTPVE